MSILSRLFNAVFIAVFFLFIISHFAQDILPPGNIAEFLESIRLAGWNILESLNGGVFFSIWLVVVFHIFWRLRYAYKNNENWSALAEQFHQDSNTDEFKIKEYLVSGTVGETPFNSIIWLGFSENGIHLRLHKFFNKNNSKLLIPWKRITGLFINYKSTRENSTGDSLWEKIHEMLFTKYLHINVKGFDAGYLILKWDDQMAKQIPSHIRVVDEVVKE